jgi:hypothetical protein
MDSYTVRLRVIFVLLFILFAVLCFAQSYRVRAVSGKFYIPDTVQSGGSFKVVNGFNKDNSRYLTDSTMLFSIHNDSYRFCVLTSPDQVCDLMLVSGSYGWELIHRERFGQWQIATGVIFVK